MLPEHFERPALLRSIQAPRRTNLESFGVAALFAAQTIVCSLILFALYSRLKTGGLWWACVSAVLVLQPGIEQSISASAIRIAANLIGATIGLAIGRLLGAGPTQVLTAMVIVVFVCEGLRLDLGLRTACVSVIVVMTANEGRVVTTSVERFSAVFAGCGVAVVVQLIVERLESWFGWRVSGRPEGSRTQSAEHG